jgi:hypothetical protein
VVGILLSSDGLPPTFYALSARKKQNINDRQDLGGEPDSKFGAHRAAGNIIVATL